MRKAPRRTIVIAGAGIAGMSTAWALHKQGLDTGIVLLDKSARVGGRIETDQRFGVDHGAHYFLRSERAIWRLLGDVGLTGDVAMPSEKTQVFAVGRHRASGWFPGVIGRLFPDAGDTSRRLTRLFREAAQPSFGGDSEAPGTFSPWLDRRIGRDTLARRFVRVLLKGDLCAPHSHISANLGAACLAAQVSSEERWYRLRSGLGTLVERMATLLRQSDVRLVRNWKVRDVAAVNGKVIVRGIQRGRAQSLECHALVMAAPLTMEYRVGGARPRACYHGYVSVLVRTTAQADRMLDRVVQGGGLYTDLRLNYLSREGSGVYRVLVPDAGWFARRPPGAIIGECRAMLDRLIPGVGRELSRVPPDGWSIRRWTIGLPCSRQARSVVSPPGVFWAGDWRAKYPSVDGAIESGLDAAAQVHAFLMGQEASSLSGGNASGRPTELSG